MSEFRSAADQCNTHIQPRLVTTKNGKSECVLQRNVCPIFDLCGKCALLNMTYKEQLIYKSQKAKKTVFEFGSEFANVSVKDCVQAPEKLAFSYSVHLKISENPLLSDNHEVLKHRIDIGYYQPKFNRVIDIGRCPIQAPHINDIIAWLRPGIRIHRVPIYSKLCKDGLLQSVIVRSAWHTKQVFIYFVVTKFNSALLRALACDITSKFTNVRGIFMKKNDDSQNEKLILLTGHSDLQDSFLEKPIQQNVRSNFHPNPSMMEKLVKRILDIKESYSGKDSLSIVTSNAFLKTVIHCSSLEDILKEKPKMMCYISGLSKKTGSILQMLTKNNYNLLFIEPFDVLPGTDYFESIMFFQKNCHPAP